MNINLEELIGELTVAYVCENQINISNTHYLQCKALTRLKCRKEKNI